MNFSRSKSGSGVLLAVAIILLSISNLFANNVTIHVETEAITATNQINNVTNTVADESLPLPVKLMDQYIRWHSEDSLQASPENRTFVVAYYTCPHKAGNFMTNFLNSLKWAIVTNRTLLYTYSGPSVVCLSINETFTVNPTNATSSTKNASSSCSETMYYNSEQDCARVIERASWLPSYEKWSKHSILQNETIVKLDFWSTSPKGIPGYAQRYHSWQDGNERHAGVDAKNNLHVVQFPRSFGQTDYLAQAGFRTYLLKTPWSREVAQGLYAEGMSFLYGMLYRRVFTPTALTRRFRSGQINKTTFTVGLHSRHMLDRLDGRNVRREQGCLSRIFNAHYNKTIYSSCTVYLMSDRELTLKRLSLFARTNLGCDPIVADHRQGESERMEHGPFAGTGFFQDMELLAHGTRHGFVGTTTTSTDFVLSAIVYDRFMDLWNKSGGQKVESLEVCRFQRGAKG